MNKIKTILLSTILGLSLSSALANEVVDKEQIEEMSIRYIETSNQQLDLGLTDNQKDKMIENMVDYIYHFKDAKSTDETQKLEKEYTATIKEILNEEQWDIISKEIEKKAAIE